MAARYDPHIRHLTSARWVAILVAAVAWAGTARGATEDPLSPAERAWLEAHGPLRYAPDPAFPPFEFFDAQGRVSGITPELLGVVASNLGTRIEAVRFGSWSDVLAAIRRGDADLIGTVTRTVEREGFLRFSRPYLEVPYVLFVDQAVSPSATLEDFRDARVGVVRNYGAHDWLLTQHPEIDSIPVETAKEGLLLLSLGRLDAMVETLPVGARVVSDNSLINVRFLPEVLFSTPQHLAVARTNAILLSILQKGLDTIPDRARAALIGRWMGYDELKPSWHLPAWAGQAVALLTLGLVLLALWNLSLRRVVARQTRALGESEARLRLLLDTLPQKIFLKDTASRFVFCNRAFARDLRAQPEDVVGRTDFDYFPRELAMKYRADDAEVAKAGHVIEMDEEYQERGQRRWIHTVKAPWRDDKGQAAGVLGIFWDITDRRQAEEDRAELEAQLRQAQKMEAVGRLAGGLAHDFNNILTVVMGNANLIREDRRAAPEVREAAGEITQAATRASELIRQLLAFSRRQVVRRQALNLNDIVARMEKILTPLLGAHVTLVRDTDPALPPVAADAGMMEQVIMNLALNARDAMPQGGTLTLRTETEASEAASTVADATRPPGRYVVLRVCDTGVGMDEDTRAHLFEPFFTTKDTGRGTGLGLATVYGIAQQHGGWVEVETTPGRGSCFSVYLPMAFESPAQQSPAPPVAELARGTEVVLVVEDEAALRKVAGATLQRLGYRVLDAASAADALVLWESVGPQVQLLFTDIVMPGGLSGLDLARRLRAGRPDLKVLFTSGYSDDVFFRRADLPADSVFLPKPYDNAQLAAAVREALAPPAGPA